MVVDAVACEVVFPSFLFCRENTAVGDACCPASARGTWHFRYRQAQPAPFTIALDRVVSLGYRPPGVLDSVERFVRDELAG